MDRNAPITWENNHLVTADDLNKQLSANLNFLHTPPEVRVYNDANISIPNATYTVLTFNTERYDSDNIHNLASATDRLTCNTVGKYLIWGHVFFGSNATGIRQLLIKLNGSTYIMRSPHSIDNTGSYCLAMTVAELSVDDYVELLVYQNSGGALLVNYSTLVSPEFGMQRIG